jgi:hypothetical protein
MMSSDDDNDLEPTSPTPTVNDTEEEQREKNYVDELLAFIQSRTLEFSPQFNGGENVQLLHRALTLPITAHLVQCCHSRLSFVANARFVWNDKDKRKEMLGAYLDPRGKKSHEVEALLPDINDVLNIAFNIISELERKDSLNLRIPNVKLLPSVCKSWKKIFKSGENDGATSHFLQNRRTDFGYHIGKTQGSNMKVTSSFIGGQGGSGVSINHEVNGGGDQQTIATSNVRKQTPDGASGLVQQLFRQKALTSVAIKTFITNTNISDNLKEHILKQVRSGNVAELAQTTQKNKSKDFRYYYTQNPLTWLIEAIDRLHDFKEGEPADVCREILYSHFIDELMLVSPSERLDYLALLSKFMDRIPSLQNLWGTFNWAASPLDHDASKRRHFHTDDINRLTFFDYVTLGVPKVLEIEKEDEDEEYLGRYYTPSNDQESIGHIKDYMVNEFTKVLSEGGTPFIQRVDAVESSTGTPVVAFIELEKLHAATKKEIERATATGPGEFFEMSEQDLEAIVESTSGPISEGLHILSANRTLAFWWDAFKNAGRFRLNDSLVTGLATPVTISNGFNAAAKHFDKSNEKIADLVERPHLSSSFAALNNVSDGETWTITSSAVFPESGILPGPVTASVTLAAPIIAPVRATTLCNDSIMKAEDQIRTELPLNGQKKETPKLITEIIKLDTWQSGAKRRTLLCTNMGAMGKANQAVQSTTKFDPKNKKTTESAASMERMKLRADKMEIMRQARAMPRVALAKEDDLIKGLENKHRTRLEPLGKLLTSTILDVSGISKQSPRLVAVFGQELVTAMIPVTSCDKFYFVEVKKDNDGKADDGTRRERWYIKDPHGVKIYPFGFLPIDSFAVETGDGTGRYMIPLATVLSLEQCIRDEIGLRATTDLDTTEEGRQIIGLCDAYLNDKANFAELLPYKSQVLSVLAYQASHAFQGGSEIDANEKDLGARLLPKEFIPLDKAKPQTIITTMLREIFFGENKAEFDSRPINSDEAQELVDRIIHLSPQEKMEKIIAAGIPLQNISTDLHRSTAAMTADKYQSEHTTSSKPNFFSIIEKIAEQCYLEFRNKARSHEYQYNGHDLLTPRVALREITTMLEGNVVFVDENGLLRRLKRSWEYSERSSRHIIKFMLIRLLSPPHNKLPSDVSECIEKKVQGNNEIKDAFMRTFQQSTPQFSRGETKTEPQLNMNKVGEAMSIYKMQRAGTHADVVFDDVKEEDGTFDNKRPLREEGERQVFVDKFVTNAVGFSSEPEIDITSVVRCNLLEIDGSTTVQEATCQTDSVLSVAVVGRTNYRHTAAWQREVENNTDALKVVHLMYGHHEDKADEVLSDGDEWGPAEYAAQHLYNRRNETETTKMGGELEGDDQPKIKGKPKKIGEGKAIGFSRHNDGRYSRNVGDEPETRRLTVSYDLLASSYVSYSLGLDIYGLMKKTLEEENIFTEDLRRAGCKTRLELLSTYKSKTSGDDLNACTDRVMNMSFSQMFEANSRIPELIRSAFGSFDRSGCIMAAVKRVATAFIDTKGRKNMLGGLNIVRIKRGKGGAKEQRVEPKVDPEEILMMDYLSETIDIMWLGKRNKQSKQERYQKLLLSIIEIVSSIFKLPDVVFEKIKLHFNFIKTNGGKTLQAQGSWLLKRLAEIFHTGTINQETTKIYLDAIVDFITRMNQTQTRSAVLHCTDKDLLIRLESNRIAMVRMLRYITEEVMYTVFNVLPPSSEGPLSSDEGLSDEGSSDEGSSDEGSSDEGSSDEGSTSSMSLMDDLQCSYHQANFELCQQYSRQSRAFVLPTVIHRLVHNQGRGDCGYISLLQSLLEVGVSVLNVHGPVTAMWATILGEGRHPIAATSLQTTVAQRQKALNDKHIDRTIANLREYFAEKIPNYNQRQRPVLPTPSSSHRPEQPWMTGAELTAIARFLKINIAFFDATGPGWRYYRYGQDAQGRNLGDFNPFNRVEMEQPTIFIYGNNIHYQSINISSDDAIWQEAEPALRAQVNHDLVMGRYDQAKQSRRIGRLELQALDRQKKSTQGYLTRMSDATKKSLAALTGLGVTGLSPQDIRSMAVDHAVVQASLKKSTPPPPKRIFEFPPARPDPRKARSVDEENRLEDKLEKIRNKRSENRKKTLLSKRTRIIMSSEALQAINDGEIIMETEDKRPEENRDDDKQKPNKARRSRARSAPGQGTSMRKIYSRLQRATPPEVVDRLSAEDAARLKRVVKYLKNRLNLTGGKSKKRRHRRRKTRRKKKRRKRKSIKKRRKRGRKTRRK